MFLELQLSVHELKNVLMSRIRALPHLALTEPVGLGMIDRIRVGEPTFEVATAEVTRIPTADGPVEGRRLRARVPLVAAWVSERALAEAGHRPAPWAVDHTAEAVVEFDVTIDGAGRPALEIGWSSSSPRSTP
ncbi:MAG: hypothetical protein R3F59_11960 [Myxococcota bacterium]